MYPRVQSEECGEHSERRYERDRNEATARKREPDGLGISQSCKEVQTVESMLAGRIPIRGKGNGIVRIRLEKRENKLDFLVSLATRSWIK